MTLTKLLNSWISFNVFKSFRSFKSSSTVSVNSRKPLHSHSQCHSVRHQQEVRGVSKHQLVDRSQHHLEIHQHRLAVRHIPCQHLVVQRRPIQCPPEIHLAVADLPQHRLAGHGPLPSQHLVVHRRPIPEIHLAVADLPQHQLAGHRLLHSPLVKLTYSFGLLRSRQRSLHCILACIVELGVPSFSSKCLPKYVPSSSLFQPASYGGSFGQSHQVPCSGCALFVVPLLGH
mmetsp:Transcript_43400/g.76887  ORF Transcript_43400/g.76887 Transcript_43400/m.76887 type:complete len:230 (+) Transcript_43400:111-800(+)